MQWVAAAAVAALGAWILFDAKPGVNWPIWTAPAVTGLILFAGRRNPGHRPPTGLGILAVVISGSAVVSASPFIGVLTVVSVILLLALSMLLSRDVSLTRLTAGFAIAAPIVAFANAIVAAFSRAVEATDLVKSPGAKATVRGLAITIPIVVAFALLLSSADPTFASWREAIAHLVTSWDFVPRTIFFTGLLVLTIGAYSYASAAAPDSASPGDTSEPHRWLGSAERSILLGGVSGLLWLFMLVQLSYMFGNLPALEGSGITFAEYARRGFGEMTIVAAASLLITIVSERYGVRDGREKFNRALTFALIVAVLFLLGSAFRRVLLYEAAYGFTLARLYAQAFMVIVAAALAALSAEVLGEIDTGRLFRRIAAVAAAVFVTLIYWNHEAWIATRNINRYVATGKLDEKHLVNELSPNAVPAIVERLPSLPEPVRTSLAAAMLKRQTALRLFDDERWFEWSLPRVRAREALRRAGASATAE